MNLTIGTKERALAGLRQSRRGRRSYVALCAARKLPGALDGLRAGQQPGRYWKLR